MNLSSKILRMQQNEITEHWIYKNLSLREKNEDNKRILESISLDELSHYNFWRLVTKKDIKPNRLKIWFYYFIARYFGLNFGIRLMEQGEGMAQNTYGSLKTVDEQKIGKIIKDEEYHEQLLLGLVNKDKLKYTSSVVLGLNDALIELTGVLAGFTLALQNTQLIAVVGFITGIAATLSMSASGYLSSKEEASKNPVKSSLYTGLAYFFTVILLVLPYVIFRNPYICLAVVIGTAIIIIFTFNFYISIAKNLSFKKRFLEMVIISLGVAILNFFIGLLVKTYFHIDE